MKATAAARPHFGQLYQFVRGLLPNTEELLNYGILGYTTDAWRAKVFFSGFKDHVAIYPVPADPSLQNAIKSHKHGKSSIWFALDEPLPLNLIQKL